MREVLGGVRSARTLMYSVDFGEIAGLQTDGNWTELEKIMISAARRLKLGGADFLLICTNTMHFCADEIENSVELPVLHIADATGQSIRKAGLKKVGLLGTKFTMEKDFLRKRLHDNFGVETIIPRPSDRDKGHSVIYEELVKGKIRDASRKVYLEIIERLTSDGAEGIILGCTEIPLLVSKKDTNCILFDTTTIHAEKAVEFSLA